MMEEKKAQLDKVRRAFRNPNLRGWIPRYLLTILEQGDDIEDTLSKMEYDAAHPYAVLMSDEACLTIQAMAEKDEKALNNRLVQHIKNERKWPVGYSVFVDAYSIAYLKLARLNHMDCELDVIEVPKMFFDETVCKIDTSETRLYVARKYMEIARMDNKTSRKKCRRR